MQPKVYVFVDISANYTDFFGERLNALSKSSHYAGFGEL